MKRTAPHLQSTRTGRASRPVDRPTWEEESGLLEFLSGVRAEAHRFAEALGFELETDLPQPRAIDGDPALPRALGFMVVRRNALLASRPYCLYTLIQGRELRACVGIYTEGNITTLRELSPLSEFKLGEAALYDWLRALLKASCDKL